MRNTKWNLMREFRGRRGKGKELSFGKLPELG